MGAKSLRVNSNENKSLIIGIMVKGLYSPNLHYEGLKTERV